MEGSVGPSLHSSTHSMPLPWLPALSQRPHPRRRRRTTTKEKRGSLSRPQRNNQRANAQPTFPKGGTSVDPDPPNARTHFCTVDFKTPRGWNHWKPYHACPRLQCKPQVLALTTRTKPNAPTIQGRRKDIRHPSVDRSWLAKGTTRSGPLALRSLNLCSPNAVASNTIC